MFLMKYLLARCAPACSRTRRIAFACTFAAFIGRTAISAPAEAQESPRKPAPATAKTANPASPSPKPATQSTQSTQSTNWQSLFDGKTLTGWKETDFAGRGAVKVESGQLLLD